MSATTPMFVTTRYGQKIEAVEVVKTTACFVTYIEKSFDGKRSHESRVGIDGSKKFHATWGDAHASLIERAERAVTNARRDLESANGTLGNIKGMKPPTA